MAGVFEMLSFKREMCSEFQFDPESEGSRLASGVVQSSVTLVQLSGTHPLSLFDSIKL